VSSFTHPTGWFRANALWLAAATWNQTLYEEPGFILQREPELFPDLMRFIVLAQVEQLCSARERLPGGFTGSSEDALRFHGRAVLLHLVDQRRAGGELQRHHCSPLRRSSCITMPPVRVAVRDHQDALALAEIRRRCTDRRTAASASRSSPATRPLGGGHVVGATPQLHLVRAVPLRGVFLVEALQVARSGRSLSAWSRMIAVALPSFPAGSSTFPARGQRGV